jgi:hypothetical protein
VRVWHQFGRLGFYSGKSNDITALRIVGVNQFGVPDPQIAKALESCCLCYTHGVCAVTLVCGWSGEGEVAQGVAMAMVMAVTISP